MKKSLLFLSLLMLIGKIESSKTVAGSRAASSASVDSAIQANHTKTQLFPDRNRDLVIINDVSENAVKNPNYIGFPFIEMHINIPLSFQLLYAFQEQQLVLTTKSLFYQVQLMAEKLDDLNVSPSELEAKYDNKYRHYFSQIESTFTRPRRIGNLLKYNNYIREFNRIYNNFLHDIYKDYTCDLAIQGLLANLRSFETSEIINLFSYKILYEKFLTLGYQCKEVGQHYLLFIPQYLQNEMRGIRQDSFKDVYLGLNYSELPNYDYNRLYNHDKRSIMNTAPIYENIGRVLSQVLERLVLPYTSYQHNRPYFNIFLTGHGMPNYVAATHQDAFNRILILFQNRLQMKSLTLNSCFIGGKQFKDVFNIQNLYDNQILQSLTYPILFNGSFYASTYFNLNDFDYSKFTQNFENKELKFINVFTSLFNNLNQKNPSYDKALELWQRVFHNQRISQNFVTNYASIKFPNVPWIQPMDYDKRVKTISQVEVTAGPREIHIPQNKKIILLSANIVPSTLICEGVVSRQDTRFENVPIILPVNYDTQKYMICKLQLPNVQLPAQDDPLKFIIQVLKYMFLSLAQKVDELIEIIIEQVTIENVILQDVHIDVQQGTILFHTQQNEYFLALLQPDNSMEINGINKSILDNEIQRVRDELSDKLKKEKRFYRLEQKLSNILSQRSVSPIVQQSKRTYEAMRTAGLNPLSQSFKPQTVSRPLAPLKINTTGIQQKTSATVRKRVTHNPYQK